MPSGFWTVSEIARRYQVSRKTVQSWRRRHADFPEPKEMLNKVTPVYLPADIIRWYALRMRSSATAPRRLMFGLPRPERRKEVMDKASAGPVDAAM
jgi:transposase-like protein